MWSCKETEVIKLRRLAYIPIKERGVYLSLGAVSFAVLLSFLIVFGSDLVRVKYAAVHLQTFADATCRDTAQGPLVIPDPDTTAPDHTVNGIYNLADHAAIISIFAGIVNGGKTTIFSNAWGLKGSLSKAWIVLPTMHTSSNNFFTPASTDISGCGLGSGNCTLLYDVSANNIKDRYPPGVWDDPPGATAVTGYPVFNRNNSTGNTIGCEFEATLNTFFSGSRTVKAISVWRTTVRGTFGSGSSTLSATAALRATKGLSILIGPEVTTHVNMANFRFEGGFGEAEQAINPLLNFDTRRFFNLSSNRHLTSAWFWKSLPALLSQTSGTDTGFFRYTKADDGSAVVGTSFVRDVAGLGLYSDREELLTACANPLVYFRNSVLSSIVELASRNGQLRSSTEVLIMNPTVNYATYPNGPTEVVRFGDDLTSAAYELPFIIYEDPNKGGVTDQVGSATWKYHHSLLANQLRLCNHLYYAGGLERPQLPTIVTIDGGGNSVSANAGYESFGASSLYFFDRYPRGTHGVNDPAADNFWDQASLDGTLASYGGRLLNAAELVGTLGTVQSCPYGQIVDPSLNDGNYFKLGRCVKPNSGNAAVEVRADVLSALQRIGPGTNSAFASPRITQFDADSNGRPDNKIAGARPTDASETEILVVLHRALSGAAERDAIAAQVNSIQGVTCGRNVTSCKRWSRPITVLFFPAYPQDSTPTKIEDLHIAFQIPSVPPSSGATEPSPNGNSIYVFTPFLEKYVDGTDGFGPDELDPGDPTKLLNPEINFRRFYDAFTSNGAAVTAARLIYSQSILRQPEPKL